VRKRGAYACAFVSGGNLAISTPQMITSLHSPQNEGLQ
jgi:hypothetical protein